MYTTFLIQPSSDKLEPGSARIEGHHTHSPLYRDKLYTPRGATAESNQFGDEQTDGKKKSLKVTFAHRLCMGRA